MDILFLLAEPTTWIAATIASAGLYITYWYGTSTFNVFSDQGIPGPKPIPFIGTAWGMWKQNVPQHDRKMADKYGKVFGTFEGMKPTLRVNDTEIIRSVFIKDFDHFVNRRKVEYPEVKVLRKMLLVLKDQNWKDVRSAVTPTFTAAKIKQYSLLMKKCADSLCVKLHSIAAREGKLNLKDQMSVVTMDVIAKCAFGMTIDNLGTENDPFIDKAQKIFGSKERKSPAIMLAFILPAQVMQILGKLLFNLDNWKFFINIMETMIEERSKSTQRYHDFPETAVESITAYTKEENGRTVPMWSKEEVNEIVAAQATIFMLAGYDTTANTLTAACYQLARHPEIQEKMYDIIMSKIEQYGDVCHEMLSDIPYVDQFMQEVLRMHPPITTLERQCNRAVTYKGIHIPKDMIVSVSTYALHYSTEYYTDPESFNPDRWSPENKAKMNPYAYMPFGMGPRNCIGMRFAQEKYKMILCILIKEFSFFPVEETPAKFGVEDGYNQVTQPEQATIGIASRV